MNSRKRDYLPYCKFLGLFLLYVNWKKSGIYYLIGCLFPVLDAFLSLKDNENEIKKSHSTLWFLLNGVSQVKMMFAGFCEVLLLCKGYVRSYKQISSQDFLLNKKKQCNVK